MVSLFKKQSEDGCTGGRTRPIIVPCLLTRPAQTLNYNHETRGARLHYTLKAGD